MIKDDAYWERVEKKAKELNSDGCTGVVDFHIRCCWEHDIAYVLGTTVDGVPQDKATTDAEFRRCIQSQSKFGVLSPMSWVRWLGVKWFGRGIWKNQK